MNNIEKLQMKQSVELKQLKAKHIVELQRIKGNVRCCWECNKLFNYIGEEDIRLGDCITCPKCEEEDHTAITEYSDEEEEDEEQEQLYCEQVGCNYQTNAVSATEDGWCCADGTWSCIKCVRK
jgi:hypothetical protein